ncbi:hypothetical protein [Pseudacidobacterium ailaaui]|jgi:hypothetical protein|uniref:hypothetical protein n=1 Tax=Pseudacidobacterium ailaaui TaxID=1382359 RepID=UPI0005D219EC|nr:hypothetical protein [Pseudacidobacterium ailaaui]MBX6359090.1 hypothetical protein [Pseudacidobacterium ailaaui]MCL6463042.1 hypothetical protein [Pseudacidobacterium ailaaui]
MTRPLLLLCFLIAISAFAVSKSHTVGLGTVRRVPYSVQGDPAGANADEKELRVRPLLVDGKLKEWTTGEVHDVTDRTFAVRRALRLNDALPGDKSGQWIWQRGPWLLVDRSTGHITAVRLPDYDPAVSRVSWFRDYAAYCGLSASGRQLYAVVAQVAARKPVLAKKLGPWDPSSHSAGACGPPVWQREPLRITFQPDGQAAVSFNLMGASAVLVEDDDADTQDKP